MPLIYLKKEYYDELVKRGYEPKDIVNTLVLQFLKTGGVNGKKG
jgi:hypothetical protein